MVSEILTFPTRPLDQLEGNKAKVMIPQTLTCKGFSDPSLQVAHGKGLNIDLRWSVKLVSSHC